MGDVGVDILAPISAELLAAVVEGELAGEIRLVAGPRTLELASVCRFPVAGDIFARCMLRTGHAGGCLPVPPGRGIAVR
jgi:hypothetical protein